MLWELPIYSEGFSHRLRNASNYNEMIPERVRRDSFSIFQRG